VFVWREAIDVKLAASIKNLGDYFRWRRSTVVVHFVFAVVRFGGS